VGNKMITRYIHGLQLHWGNELQKRAFRWCWRWHNELSAKKLFSSLFTWAKMYIAEVFVNDTAVMSEHFSSEPRPCPVVTFHVSAELFTLYSVTCQWRPSSGKLCFPSLL
jgi:hypothetical protein